MTTAKPSAAPITRLDALRPATPTVALLVPTPNCPAQMQIILKHQTYLNQADRYSHSQVEDLTQNIQHQPGQTTSAVDKEILPLVLTPQVVPLLILQWVMSPKETIATSLTMSHNCETDSKS